MPLDDDPAERQRILDNLKDTAGVVRDFRGLFTDFFEVSAQSAQHLDWGNLLSPPQRTEVLAALSGNVKCWGVSDSIFVAVPLGGTRHRAVGVTDVFRSLLVAATTWFHGMSTNHPVRGGMELGAGIDIEPGEIYGQALEAAYHLESRVAESPRIVVGPKCVEFLKDVKQKQGVSDADRLAAASADLCLSVLDEDADGNTVIDGLEVMLKLAALGVPEYTPEALRVKFLRAHDNVRTNCRDFRRAGDTKLASRYETLLAYFDERAPMWRCA